MKCLGKAKTKNPAALEAKVNFFKERIELVKRFAEARKLVQSNAIYTYNVPHFVHRFNYTGFMRMTLTNVCNYVRVFWMSQILTLQ